MKNEKMSRNWFEKMRKSGSPWKRYIFSFFNFLSEKRRVTVWLALFRLTWEFLFPKVDKMQRSGLAFLCWSLWKVCLLCWMQLCISWHKWRTNLNQRFSTKSSQILVTSARSDLLHRRWIENERNTENMIILCFKWK